MHRFDGEETCAAGVGDVEVDAVDRPAVKREGGAFRERGRLALAKEAGDPGGSLRRGVHEFDRVDLAGALVFRAFGRGDRDVREFHQTEVRLAIEHAEAVKLELGGFYDRRGGRRRGRRLHFGAQSLQRGARAVIGGAVAVIIHVAEDFSQFLIRRAGGHAFAGQFRGRQRDVAEGGLVAVHVAAGEAESAGA